MKNLFNIHLNPSGSKRKEKAIARVLSQEQKNLGVKNIHRLNPNNVGDFFCAPHMYFEELKGSALDISQCRSKIKSDTEKWEDDISNNSIIIGGGGLLNIRHFHLQMKMFEELAARGKKIVLWGLGHNEINIDEFRKNKKYWIDISKFGLVGTRDYNMPGEWIPCVSCMHPIFDEAFNEQHEIGIIYNAKSIKDEKLKKKLNNFPSTSNTTNLENLVRFIGKSNTVVTNSYHAMYWSILMGKKVVAIPATSKFLDFKYKTVISTFDNFENDLTKAKSYSGVLEECRDLNKSFSTRVFDYLNI